MGIVTSCLNASSRQLLTAAADGDAETVRQVRSGVTPSPYYIHCSGIQIVKKTVA